MKVDNAWLDNGLLTVDLVRELPETLKPRSIEISRGTPKTIVDKAKKLLSTEKEAA